jgi:hypothetical protein
MRLWHSSAAYAATLAASLSTSYAGPCWDEIGSMQAKIDAKVEAKAAAGPACSCQCDDRDECSTDAALDGYR